MNPEDHFIQIYTHHGQAYHELIRYEDVDGHLRPAIEAVSTFAGKAILDLGSGTGRIPLMFPETPVTGLDLHRDMLLENQRQQAPDPARLVQADMRALPFGGHSFEIVTAGWALGHFTGWFEEKWETEAAKVLNEMHRVVAPSGSILILETMTTGSHTAAPPNPALGAYYHWLEEEWGFTRQVIQTDFLFDDLDQAVRLTRFFFGDGLAKKVRKQGWVRLPEWTGLWSKTA